MLVVGGPGQPVSRASSLPWLCGHPEGIDWFHSCTRVAINTVVKGGEGRCCVWFAKCESSPQFQQFQRKFFLFLLLLLTCPCRSCTHSSLWSPQDRPGIDDDDDDDDEGTTGRPPVADADTLSKRKCVCKIGTDDLSHAPVWGRCAF